jgi:hypothetical protein
MCPQVAPHTEVSEERSDSIFKVENISREGASRKLGDACRLRLVGPLPGMLFNPETGSSTFLRNCGEILLDYTASHPRTQYRS